MIFAVNTIPEPMYISVDIFTQAPFLNITMLILSKLRLKYNEAVNGNERIPAMKKTLLKTLSVILCLLVLLEIGGRIRQKRFVKNNLAVAVETSMGKKLSPRPGNLYVVTDPFCIYRMKPNQKFKNCRINKWGFRGRDFELNKSVNTYRIIITGGSAAFGDEMYEDSKMFDKLMEDKINAKGDIRVEIINTGDIGFNSAMELALFTHYLIPFKPDMIINFTGWNDFHIPNVTPGNRPDTSPFYVMLEGHLTNGPFQSFCTRSMACYLIQREGGRIIRQMGVTKAGKEGVWKYHQKSVDYFRQNMGAFAALAEGMGIKHVIALQPEENSRSNPCEAEKNDLNLKRGPKYIKAVSETYAAFKKAAADIADKYPDTEFIDTTGSFDKSKECIFIDWVHFNETGHAALADFLAPRLDTIIRGKQTRLQKAL